MCGMFLLEMSNPRAEKSYKATENIEHLTYFREAKL